MYLTPTDKHWVLDAEWNAPLNTKIWVVSFKNAVTKEKHSFTEYEKIRDFIADGNATGAKWVGHNIIAADAPILNRLIGTRLDIYNLVDTLLLSMCYSPSIAGGHSLAAWAERFGKKKVEHEEWGVWSPEMLHRNQYDVELGWELFIKLTARIRSVGLSERFLEIEHKAWNIIQNKQKKNGFHFDFPRAHQLFAELQGVKQELEEDVHKVFPPQLEIVKRYKNAYRKDGSFNSIYEHHLEQYPRLQINNEGGYYAYDWISFNLGSPKQRIEKLLELGWEPREFTEITEKGGGGNPQVTYKGDLVPSLQEFVEKSGIKEVRMLAEWIALNGRTNAINNWMELYNPDTGAIHGNLWLANTLRYRHSDPNTANIPRIRKSKDKGILRGREGLWTYEARDLWTTRDQSTRNLVGVDAVAIQFRVLANALNNEEFTNVVLSGDIHSYNQSKTGIGDRDQNKTFGYAALLGAGAEKTGQIFGVSKQQGGKIKNKWIKTVPGLRELYDRLENELRRDGRITLCDGSRVLVPSPHMVLAYLLQGDESRIMKQAMIWVDERVEREGLDILKVGDIHDEWQSDCEVDDTGRYIEICEQSFREAGESFNYNLPIDCSAKVGLTWAETH